VATSGRRENLRPFDLRFCTITMETWWKLQEGYSKFPPGLSLKRAWQLPANTSWCKRRGSKILAVGTCPGR
jgi:hypothetical protein